MKNLANCKPSEFLIQTNKIRKSVANWLTLTDIASIRKRMPKLVEMSEGMTADQIAEATLENSRRNKEQLKKNFSSILDAALEDHPAETLEVMALMCFVDPKDVDNYPMSDYIDAISDLISNESVLSFFTSLMKLERIDTSNIANP